MIGSVQKAMKILSVISEGKNSPVSLASISRDAGINKATCSHIISTLAEEGFVERISHSSGYVIGPAAFCLSRFGKYRDDFISVCHPVVRWLHKKTGCAIVLAVVEGGRKYVIDYIDPENKILPEVTGITPDDIYRTATGRIIMANMSSRQIKGVFDKNGAPPPGHWDKIDSLEALENELAVTDGRSVIKTDRFGESPSIGYAAAVYKLSKCVGAVGVAVDIDDITPPKEADIKNCILKARAEIGRRLEYM